MNSNNDDVDLNIPIGTVVRKWREAKGLTVTQLAEKAGRPVTKGYLSELEHNKTLHPGNVHLTQLAKALGIPVRYLINRFFPDMIAETQQAAETPARAIEDSIDKLLPRGQRELSFGAPDLSEIVNRDSEAHNVTLRKVLEEIEEISRRIEELRRVVENLLQIKGKQQ
jgi:transcriptional regulator with XRE-family HTH domain